MLRITLITVGNKMPTWVKLASKDYETRLKSYAKFSIIEIPSAKNTSQKMLCMQKEAEHICQAIPHHTYLIALDSLGTSFKSEQLAKKIEILQQQHSSITLIIGGHYGLAKNILDISTERWSLSPLTLPHPLCRVVLLETLYRTLSIQANHPYHK